MSSPTTERPGTPAEWRRRTRSAPDARANLSRGSWWYLFYLVSLVFQPLFDPATTLVHWVGAAAVVAVYVPLFGAASRSNRLAWWMPYVSLGFTLTVFWFNSGALVFAVYAAAFVASTRPRKLTYRWCAFLSLCALGLTLVAPVPLPYNLVAFGFPAVIIWVVALTCLADIERERQTDQLRVENVRVEHLATAAERERLARDLHDALGQTLTEVVVRSQLARKVTAKDPDRAAKELAEIERAARRSLDEVRSAVKGWREVRIDDELAIAERALGAGEVRVHIERDPAFNPPPTTETALALALREATTNVVRHANASNCRIAFSRDGIFDVVEVSDDGVGTPAPDGEGLTGMRERVVALGGEMIRECSNGTTMTVRAPSGVAR